MKNRVIAMVMVAVGFLSAVALCLRTLNAQAVSSFSEGSMRVVVDAGHGGIDGGVSGKKTGVKESDLNLSIAMRLAGRLQDAGFDVVMTRRTEAGLYDSTAKGFKRRDMQKRKEIIQKADPALLLSVHQNYYPSQGARGGQVFYSSKIKGSERLAEETQGRLNALYEKEGAKGRKKTTGEYFMLECYPCPSVIIECGFLSNERDEELLNSPAFQERLAEEIAAAALAYYAEALA